MKKLILSVFMFALIAGASVHSTASTPMAETPGVVATPNLIYCMYSSNAALTAGAVLGGIAGGGTTAGLLMAGWSIVAAVSIGTGVGAVLLGAGI